MLRRAAHALHCPLACVLLRIYIVFFDADIGGRTALERTMTTLTVALDRLAARKPVRADDLLFAEDDPCVARELCKKSKARSCNIVALAFCRKVGFAILVGLVCVEVCSNACKVWRC
eukprot:6467398-Amphidinium_carterae.1